MSGPALHQRQLGAPLWRIAWWYLLHLLCFAWFVPVYRYRAWGINRIPRTGPLLFVSNHQSFFDPIVVGLAGHRRQFWSLARSTLFNYGVFSWLIRSLNAIPVVQGAGDLPAIRTCIDVLARGHALLVFPEGARTLDGTTGRFQTGTMLLIKRARPTVVPVAIEGGFAVWPRGRALPRAAGRIGGGKIVHEI